MKPCRKCNKNKWRYLFNDNTRMVTAVCLTCNNEVSFPAKPRKAPDTNRVIPFAEYEMRDGKTYLRTDDHDFIEVGIQENYRGHLKVVPIECANFDTKSVDN